MESRRGVFALLDNTGAVVVKYKYDAWGMCIVDTSTTNTDLATLNPFRYRSYYYGNLGEYEIKIDLGKNFNRATARYLYNFIG